MTRRAPGPRAIARGAASLGMIALGAAAWGACAFIDRFPDVAPDPMGSSSSSSSSSGTGMSCAPGSTAPCYTGPPGTEGVGPCKGGQKTCDSQGVAYETCEGQTLPAFEDCSTSADENCDGHGCDGAQVFAKGFGDETDQGGNGIATTADGHVVVTGFVNGSVDFGEGPLSSEGMTALPDIFVATFNPDGSAGWSKRFSDGIGLGAAIAVNGDVLIAGSVKGDTDFGQGPLPNPQLQHTTNDAFLARFTPVGDVVWGFRAGDELDQTAASVAVDSDGFSVITGDYSGSMVFPGGSHLPTSASPGAFLVRIDPMGKLSWQESFAQPAATQHGTSVAIDFHDGGRILAVGTFDGMIDIKGDMYTSTGQLDFFVASFTSSGNLLWSKQFGGSDTAEAASVAVDPSGNVLVAGAFHTSLTLGTTTLSNAGDADIFVLKLDPGGDVLWAKQFGDQADQEAFGVATDSGGNVLVTGYYQSSVQFGSLPALSQPGPQNGYVAKLAPDGTALWAKSFGGTAPLAGTAVAADPSGASWATGYFGGTATFDTSTLNSMGANDIFMVKLGP